MPQRRRETAPGCRIAEECELCGSALGHQPAAAGARARTQIDDVIGAANRLFVVFDHHQGIALGAQPLEGIQKSNVVARVQADGGFIQHVAHALQIRSELRRQSDALRLAAGEAGRGAVQLQIAEPDVAEKAGPGGELGQQIPGDVEFAPGQLEGLQRRREFPYGQVREFCDRPLAEHDVQRHRIETLTGAVGAGRGRFVG